MIYLLLFVTNVLTTDLMCIRISIVCIYSICGRVYPNIRAHTDIKKKTTKPEPHENWCVRFAYRRNSKYTIFFLCVASTSIYIPFCVLCHWTVELCIRCRLFDFSPFRKTCFHENFGACPLFAFLIKFHFTQAAARTTTTIT